MWYLKSCPRCRGDLYVFEEDEKRRWLTCLLCGQILTILRAGRSHFEEATEAVSSPAHAAA